MRVFFRLLLFAIVIVSTAPAYAQDENTAQAGEIYLPAPDADRVAGVTYTSDQVMDGYVLMSIIQSKDILLMANDGRIVNKWTNEDYYAGQSAYLLPNGNLLRTVSLPNAFGPTGQWGYVNGRVDEYTWDGELVWSFELATDRLVGHHDIEPMPNGNILMVFFEKFTPEEAIAAGRDPQLISAENQLWGEVIYEIDPTTNSIVWEWHVWDHLIQDYDPAAANYGVVADHPERVDINYLDPELTPNADWLHINSITYNAERDEIMLSPRTYSELWVIDHSISAEEAKGRAGDLLYRWGNPAAHDAGTPEGRPLYFQHDPRWIPEGYPGAGNILIFDNGSSLRPYSRVIEIAPPMDQSGRYVMQPGEPTTAAIVWEYRADPPESFYSALISGAQRQPNGNTLITDGLNSRVFEVNAEGQTVWEVLLPPATWVFRAERSQLSANDFDLSSDLGFTGGAVWRAACADGTETHLFEYAIDQGPMMHDFLAQYGADAEARWAGEVCAEHGGTG